MDPAWFSEVVFADYYGKTEPNLAKADGNNTLELRIDEGGFMGWYTFGGTHWADNLLHGTKSLARYMTGGSPRNWVCAELGTYTSVYGSDFLNWTTNPETGGTFNGGGSHFYHQPAMYQRYPLDKACALSENTIVFCFGPAPSGVRSGMRPPYDLNPLLTVVGDNAGGLADAYQCVAYLTRVYFDVHSTETKHPATVKYNKVWVM